MKLSTRGKYGLYAMYYLAAHKDEGPQSLQNIATIGVPSQYLEQLLGNLRRAGLIGSVRGPQGGYRIARPPEAITVLDVLDALEGPLELSECMTDHNACNRVQGCPVRRTWQKLTDSINRELAGVTLGDMFDECEANTHGG
jgi:Rrf2 family transcriptional regulator, cysteine metabolism repressor